MDKKWRNLLIVIGLIVLACLIYVFLTNNSLTVSNKEVKELNDFNSIDIYSMDNSNLNSVKNKFNSINLSDKNEQVKEIVKNYVSYIEITEEKNELISLLEESNEKELCESVKDYDKIKLKYDNLINDINNLGLSISNYFDKYPNSSIEMTNTYLVVSKFKYVYFDDYMGIYLLAKQECDVNE
ncbi:MAG: hypothetical protein PHQ98_01080 [Candidatus ainarchaeum sp.]|nr:hypothetical protein [Candidatus ainarchaeum sp.]